MAQNLRSPLKVFGELQTRPRRLLGLDILFTRHKPELDADVLLKLPNEVIEDLPALDIRNRLALAVLPSILLPLVRPVSDPAHNVRRVRLDHESVQVGRGSVALFLHLPSFQILKDLVHRVDAGGQLGNLLSLSKAAVEWQSEVVFVAGAEDGRAHCARSDLFVGCVDAVNGNHRTLKLCLVELAAWAASRKWTGEEDVSASFDLHVFHGEIAGIVG